MSLRCGIVGLPNAGKTTIFNALTKAHAPCGVYPFTTIDANTGSVAVPDVRLDKLAELVPNDKVIHTTVEFVDVAGLVKGASQGEGLGNQFLAKIMEVDAIAHVVRCFGCSDVSHVAGSIDPVRDIETVEHELLLKDIEILDGWIAKNEKLANSSSDKKLHLTLESIKLLRDKINSGVPARQIEEADSDFLAEFDIRLLTAKPVMYVANIAESKEDAESSSHLKSLNDYAAKNKAKVVSISGKVEDELAQLNEDERKEFIKELGIEKLNSIDLIKAAYELLGLITFFTTDSRQLRAWTVSKGSKAPQAAGKIHTDFEEGFIRAEVTGFKDFIDCGSEAKAREKGLARVEGKDYEVSDGDVIHFRFQK